VNTYRAVSALLVIYMAFSPSSEIVEGRPLLYLQRAVAIGADRNRQTVSSGVFGVSLSLIISVLLRSVRRGHLIERVFLLAGQRSKGYHKVMARAAADLNTRGPCTNGEGRGKTNGERSS
jgi:hypothetical protein